MLDFLTIVIIHAGLGFLLVAGFWTRFAALIFIAGAAFLVLGVTLDTYVVERFSDYVVTDPNTGAGFWTDHEITDEYPPVFRAIAGLGGAVVMIAAALVTMRD